MQLKPFKYEIPYSFELVIMIKNRLWKTKTIIISFAHRINRNSYSSSLSQIKLKMFGVEGVEWYIFFEFCLINEFVAIYWITCNLHVTLFYIFDFQRVSYIQKYSLGIKYMNTKHICIHTYISTYIIRHSNAYIQTNIWRETKKTKINSNTSIFRQ